jgi:pimeloyl-ACP methyl ester carboxylesterase
VQLGYDRRGRGQPLLLLHSLGTDRHVWAPVIDRLAERRDVIAVDLPGFGDSPPVPVNGDAPTARVLAAAVARFCADLGVPRPHVGGNSLGGWVALQMALDENARSVTAIAPAGLWPRPLPPKPEVARRLARAAAPVLSVALASEGARRLALAGTMAHPERVPREDVVRLVRSYAAAPGYSSVNAAMRAGRLEGIERIRVPVTLVWPEFDRLVGPPRVLPPRVRSVVLRDCGHVPMWDSPDQVTELLLAGSGEWRAVA